MEKPEKKKFFKGKDFSSNLNNLAIENYNQAWDVWEKYHKEYVHQILCDMQECPAKEYHKKRIGK